MEMEKIIYKGRKTYEMQASYDSEVLGKLNVSRPGMVVPRYVADNKVDMHLFGKVFQCDVNISSDEDAVPFEKGLIDIEKQFQIIFDRKKELEAEIDTVLLEYINQEWVGKVVIAAWDEETNEPSEDEDREYGIYDEQTDSYSPYTDISQMAPEIEKIAFFTHIVVNELDPIALAMEERNGDEGLCVGIFNGKITRVGTTASFF